MGDGKGSAGEITPITQLPVIEVTDDKGDKTRASAEIDDQTLKSISSTESGPIDSPSQAVPQGHIVDRMKIVYLTMIIHGIGTLLPWNTFINAHDYFVNYKLSENYTNSNEPRQMFGSRFMLYLGIASQLPSVIFSWANIFFHHAGKLNLRIMASLTVEVVCIIFTIILAMVDTSECPKVFFWLTMLSVVIMNVAGGIFQNSVYGIGAKLGYTEVLILGSPHNSDFYENWQNICGVFTSLVNIISVSMTAMEKNAAAFYFGTGLVILVICLVTYCCVLPRLKFYRYNVKNSFDEYEDAESGHTIKIQSAPYAKVLEECWPQCLNVFLVFLVTLSVFPSILADVKRQDENFFIPDQYFTSVICFFTFNFFSLLGNLVPSEFKWPGRGYVWILVVLRTVFIPWFLMCNYQSEGWTRYNPAEIGDWIYAIGVVLFGFTNGYLGTLVMIYCANSVNREYASIAGMFGAASLVTGVLAGIVLSFGVRYLGAAPDEIMKHHISHT